MHVSANGTAMESSAVSYIEYDTHTRILYITYKGGHAYRYFGVTKKDYQKLEAAESKGGFINSCIKVKYKKYEKVADEG